MPSESDRLKGAFDEFLDNVGKVLGVDGRARPHTAPGQSKPLQVTNKDGKVRLKFGKAVAVLKPDRADALAEMIRRHAAEARG